MSPKKKWAVCLFAFERGRQPPAAAAGLLYLPSQVEKQTLESSWSNDQVIRSHPFNTPISPNTHLSKSK